MQRILFTLILAVVTLAPACAQSKSKGDFEQKRKEVIDFKVKYLIQETDLAADKQAEFERLYRQMEEEKHTMYSDLFKRASAVNKSSADSEVLAVADMIAASKQKEGAIELKFYQQFKKLLTPRQLLTLKRSEDRFNRKVMEMRGRKEGGRHQKKASGGEKK